MKINLSTNLSKPQNLKSKRLSLKSKRLSLRSKRLSLRSNKSRPNLQNLPNIR